MKCCSCDCFLNDFEATRRSVVTNEFLDLCNKCIKGLGIATQDRTDLEESFTSIYEDPDYHDYGYLVPEEGWGIIGDEE